MTNMRGVGGNDEVCFNTHQDQMDEEGDVLRNSFVGMISGVEDVVGAYTRKVARRFRTMDQTVFICRMISEPKFGSGRQGVVSTTTTTRITVAKADNIDDGEDDTTIMKVCFRTERDISAGQKDPTASLAIATWDTLVPQLPDDVAATLLSEACST